MTEAPHTAPADAPASRPLAASAWALFGLALLWGIWSAVAARWTCDDAFISFRYLDQFLAGQGLVFNEGERVEGYTNFLWIMVLAPFRALGLPLIPLSQALGILCLLACTLLLARIAWRRREAPVAAVLVVLHLHLQYFASCGLETLMFAALVTAGVILLMQAQRPAQFAAAGLCLILATMTRPDGAIFYALSSGLVVWLAWRERRWGVLWGYALPFLLLYLPYFAWKFSYYGYPVPNTFYAKSADKPYLGQGLAYVGSYFLCYWYLVPGLFGGWWLLRRARGGDLRSPGFDGRRAGFLLLACPLVYLLYVVWVGGDFMFSRFCLPVTPLLCLAIQLAWARSGRSLLLMLAAGVASFFPAYSKAWMPAQVGEERDHYPAWWLQMNEKLCARLQELFAGRRLGLAVGGGYAMQGWFGGFDYVLELNGLTDAYIAHRHIDARGKPGHEKALGIQDPYPAKRGVDLIVLGYEQYPVSGEPPAEWRKFEFLVENVELRGEVYTGFAQATLVRYHAPTLEPLLGREDVRFRAFPEYLDAYIRGLAQKDPAQVRQDLAGFRRFYFDHNEDPERLRVLEQAAR